jgi:hypothetical protein
MTPSTATFADLGFASSPTKLIGARVAVGTIPSETGAKHMTVYDQGTQKEKKAILENEAKLRQGDRPPTTYHALSQWPEAGLPAPEASPLRY